MWRLFMRHENLVAVDHVNLTIRKGEIVGLIGPNGAGKTTLVKMLSTLILPDEGTATINGYDLLTDGDLIKQEIGSMPGEYTRALYWRLSGEDNLKFFARLYGMSETQSKKRIEELLQLLQLTSWKNEYVMKYSTGMKHKIALAKALLHDPLILFLDEPTTGVDPASAFEIRRFIKEKLTEKTILWTSHNLQEVEQICDRVAILINGKVVAEGEPTHLIKKYFGYEEIHIELMDAAASQFTSIDGATILDDFHVEIHTSNLAEAICAINDIVQKNRLVFEDFKVSSPSLEDLFLEITEKKSGGGYSEG